MSFLDRRVPADREWIVIRDRKILWYNFIYLFDSSKIKDKAAMRGKSTKDNILRGGYILQRMTNAYTKGTDTIEKYYDDFRVSLKTYLFAVFILEKARKYVIII